MVSVPRCEDAPLRRDTLRFATKNYRLSPETRAILEAIRRTRPRTYLTFDELLMDLADRLLRRDHTLEAEVERYLRAHGFAELADRREDARKGRISENRRVRGLSEDGSGTESQEE